MPEAREFATRPRQPDLRSLASDLWPPASDLNPPSTLCREWKFNEECRAFAED